MYMVVNEHRLPAMYRRRHIPTHGAHMGSHKKCVVHKQTLVTNLEHGREWKSGHSDHKEGS